MMSLNLIAVRRVTLSLVALFAFFLGSLQVAFADEAYDAENLGIAEASTDVAEAIADDAGQVAAANDAAVPQLAQATDVDNNAVANKGNQDSIPQITTDKTILHSEDWVIVPEDKFGFRIGTDIGFGVLFGGVFGGIAIGLYMGAFGMEGSEGLLCSDEEMKACERKQDAMIYSAYVLAPLGAVLAPALAVHVSHVIWKSEGSVGWAYLGGLLGGAVGIGLGALPLLSPDGGFLAVGLMPTLGIVGGLAGAIIGYELSNSANREKKYGTIARVYPVLEFGPERNVVGVGIEF